MKNFFRTLGRGIAYLVGGFFRLLGRILQAVLEGFGNILVAMTAGIFAGLTGFFSGRFGIGLLLFLAGLAVFAYTPQDDLGGLLGLVGAFIALTPKKKKKRQERRRN